MNLILTGSNYLVALITVPYISRALSIEGAGAVSFAQNTANWFSAFCLLGVPIYGLRECARARDDISVLTRTVKELLSILTICTATVLIIFATAIFVLPQFRAVAPLMWIFFVNTLFLSYGVEWFFQAIEEYQYITIRTIIFKVISLVGMITFIRHESDYVLYGALLAFCTCGNNIINLIRLTTIVDLRSEGHLNLKRHIKPLFAFSMAGLASSTYLTFDSTLLGLLTNSNYQNGLYQLVARLKAFLMMAINAVVSAIIPRATAYLQSNDDKAFLNLLTKAFYLIMSMSISMCCYIWIFTKPLISLIASDKYLPAAPALMVTGFTLIFVSCSLVTGYLILTPTQQEAKLAIGNFVALPVSLVLNFALDGHLGAFGASVALACTELATVCFQIWFARETFKKIINLRSVLTTLAPIATASFTANALDQAFSTETPVINLLIGGITYGIVWLISLYIFREKVVTALLHTYIRKLRKK